MANIQTWLGEAKDMVGKKRRQKYSISEKSAPKEASLSSSMYLLADFGVPLAQRWWIEAKEGAKTIGGVGKDLVTKKAWTDPRKNKIWVEDLGKGFSEARNRVQQSLRKANDANIEKELTKNKKAMEEEIVRKMRSSAKQKYQAGGLRDIAPLTRSENDGLLQVDKRFGIGNKAKK